MKKIMFDDRFDLTQAVLNGGKTMTRRVIPPIEVDWVRRGVVTLPISSFKDGLLFMDTSSILPDSSEYLAPAKYQPKYKVGEVVAIAQSYFELGLEFVDHADPTFKRKKVPQWGFTPRMKGWTNKMYVRADVMPHQIRITDIRIERIQDISNEDCIREGVSLDETAPPCYQPFYTFPGSIDHDTPVGYKTPREAFAALIKKLYGNKTWHANPYVFVYTFELVK